VMRIVQDHAIHFPGDKCALGESCWALVEDVEDFPINN
jgi:hypothetical protein